MRAQSRTPFAVPLRRGITHPDNGPLPRHRQLFSYMWVWSAEYWTSRLSIDFAARAGAACDGARGGAHFAESSGCVRSRRPGCVVRRVTLSAHRAAASEDDFTRPPRAETSRKTACGKLFCAMCAGWCAARAAHRALEIRALIRCDEACVRGSSSASRSCQFSSSRVPTIRPTRRASTCPAATATRSTAARLKTRAAAAGS